MSPWELKCFGCGKIYGECFCPRFPIDEAPGIMCPVCGKTDHEVVTLANGVRVMGCPEVPVDRPFFLARPKEKTPESSDPEVCYLCKRQFLKCRCLPL